MMQNNCSIRIPMISGCDQVEFYPDELPVDFNDLIDVLRSELAPFKVWRACAIEYHKQGLHQEFYAVLTEIVMALEDISVDKIYRDREDYSEGITEIYVALAAKALGELTRLKDHGMYQSIDQNNDLALKVVTNLGLADDKQRINEYTWLIKGFYEIIQGDMKRAEDHFRAVHDRATKGSTALSKQKYLFGSLLGLGIVSFARQKYQVSLDHFSKAIMTHPSCGANIRMAVACCCFKLEQFERAKMATDKAFELEPANVNVLVMKALLEQPATNLKDRNKAIEHRSLSSDFCKLAHSMDPQNALALNLLANQAFQTPRIVLFGAGCAVLDSRHLILVRESVVGVLAEDLVSFENTNHSSVFGLEYRISDILSESGVLSFGAKAQSVVDSVGGATVSDFVVLELSSDLPLKLVTEGSPLGSLQFRELGKALDFAKQALILSASPSLRADSHFLIGKIAHIRGNNSEAFDCYRRALKESPELSLAAFGAAQILFSRSEFAAALELFEKVLTKCPDDKDTQAYVMLLKALHKGVVTPIDKLREIAPGFRFEIDLWLLQGQLRQKLPSEHASAMKCFLLAKECIEHLKGPSVPPALLSNIAVLYQSLGRLDKALEYIRLALTVNVVHRKSELNVNAGSIHSNADFENIFYAWNPLELCFLTQTSDDSEHFSLAVDNGDNQMDLSLHIAPGDEVVIRDVRFTVKEVTAKDILCYRPPVRLTQSTIDGHPLFIRTIFDNFTDDTLTFCYNLARVLEDLGRTKSASEVYVELLKKHPSFIECYLRLSLISCDIGKFDDASVWLTRALEVSDDEPDATICLGDLYQRKNLAADAKKCYDKICSSNRHDARSMLSLGNYYFSAASGKPDQNQMKESYKFFFHVLNEDQTNIYAANGLGMVCAERGEVDAARDIFSKAREANKSLSEDISTNLAHVFVTQKRIVDAERLYQATYKSISCTSGEAVASRSAYLSECVAFSQLQHGRHEDALRSVQRATHMNPGDVKTWFNMAVVAENAARIVLAKRTQKSVMEITEATQDIILANKVFGFIKLNHNLIKQGSGVRVSTVEKHLVSCETIEKELILQLTAAQLEDSKRQEERVRQEFEHSSRQRIKQEEKQKLIDAAESEKRDKQLLAVQKDRQLQELREKWITTSAAPVNPTVSAGGSRGRQNQGGGGGKRKKKGEKGNEAEGGGEVFEEGEGFDRVDRKNYQGEIDFGSSSDEQSDDEDDRPVPVSVSSHLGAELFGDDLEDDFVNEKGKRTISAVENASYDGKSQQPQAKRLMKRSSVHDDRGNSSESEDLLDDDDELQVMGDIEAHKEEQGLVARSGMLVASDEEDN